MPSGASWPRMPAILATACSRPTLTLGIFLPLRFYEGDMRVLAGQSRLVSDIDARPPPPGSRHPAVRPRFGDAGQLFDPFTYLATSPPGRSAFPGNGAIFSLRHPIDLAKAAATIDQLSGGRLVMGIASGDRPISSPPTACNTTSAERFAQAVADFRRLLQPAVAP